MRIYLDACAISRLTDDPSQIRIGREADSVELVFLHVRAGRVLWIASSILEAELRRIRDVRRRSDVLALLPYASEFRLLNPEVTERGRVLSLLGYGLIDALHLAIAENSAVDLLLTTDDRFLRQARRGLGRPSIRIANPVDYVKEMKP